MHRVESVFIGLQKSPRVNCFHERVNVSVGNRPLV